MAGPETGEKMQAVVEALCINPAIVVVGGIEKVALKQGDYQIDPMWQRTLGIFTYPQVPAYDASSLNKTMFNMVPDIDPSMHDDFYEAENGLSLGKLYFDETIGTARIKTDVNLDADLSVVTRGDLESSWEVNETINLRQRTWVRLFPDLKHLINAALYNQNTDVIPTNVLQQKRTKLPKYLKKLFGSEPANLSALAKQTTNKLNSPTITAVHGQPDFARHLVEGLSRIS